MNIPLFKIYTDEADVEAVTKVIRRGSHWACGAEIEEFEERVADYVDVAYAVAFNSGTSALHAALLSMKICVKDRVVVPSFTFPATANMILATGAKVIFADIEDETYGLDINAMQELFANTTIDAIIPVSYAGCPCRDLEKIVSAIPKVIEDAAESLGSEKDGIKVGSTADITMFSLCQAKVITTGDGGLLTTNSIDTRDRLLAIRDHGKVDGEYCVTLGYNWRMSSMTAALGISQLEKIEEIINWRRINSARLSTELRKVQECSLPIEYGAFRQTYQMFTIRVPQRHRNPLLAHLNTNGIGAKVYFPPVHLMPLYRKLGWSEGSLPVTEQVSKEVITLPMYPSLTTEEMDYMVEKIKEYFKV